MKINILKLTLLILSSTFLISCGSTKQLFDYGSVKTSNQIETIKISNINNLPICKVLIGEKEYNFLIDTGAPTVIPNEIFQRLKLKSFFTEEITDTNNKKRKQNFTKLQHPNFLDLFKKFHKKKQPLFIRAALMLSQNFMLTGLR